MTGATHSKPHKSRQHCSALWAQFMIWHRALELLSCAVWSPSESFLRSGLSV